MSRPSLPMKLRSSAGRRLDELVRLLDKLIALGFLPRHWRAAHTWMETANTRYM
jgi:hypothetical protein